MVYLEKNSGLWRCCNTAVSTIVRNKTGKVTSHIILVPDELDAFLHPLMREVKNTEKGDRGGTSQGWSKPFS
jgi:hypothetical protein